MNYFQHIRLESRATPAYSGHGAGNGSPISGLRVKDTITSLPGEAQLHDGMGGDESFGQPARLPGNNSGSEGPGFDPVGEPFDTRAADTGRPGSGGTDKSPITAGKEAKIIASAEVPEEVGHRGKVLRSVYVEGIQSEGHPEITEMLAQKSKEKSGMKGSGWQQPVNAVLEPPKGGDGMVSGGADPNSPSFEGVSDAHLGHGRSSPAKSPAPDAERTSVSTPAAQDNFFDTSLKTDPLTGPGPSSPESEFPSDFIESVSTRHQTGDRSQNMDMRSQASPADAGERIRIDHVSRRVQVMETAGRGEPSLETSEKSAAPAQKRILPGQPAAMNKGQALPDLGTTLEPTEPARVISNVQAQGSAGSTWAKGSRQKTTAGPQQVLTSPGAGTAWTPADRQVSRLKPLPIDRPVVRPDSNPVQEQRPEPSVHIGHIDVIVEAPPAPVSPRQKSAVPDRSSAMYLRRL